MNRSQSEKSRKRRTPLFWLFLTLLLLSLAFGGVSAYLSISSQSASNTFVNADQPGVKVNGTDVTVNPNGYAVYLRVAVDVYWKNGNSILAEEPTSGFAIGGMNWKEIGGFYYYTAPITEAITVKPVVLDNVSNGDYTLTATVAAQVIQAVGETDGDTPISAVQDAWGVRATDFLTNGAG